MVSTQFESGPFQLPLGTLQDLLELGRDEHGSERRGDPRFSFFAPVALVSAEHPGEKYKAFSREISRSGIGLFLNRPLHCGDVFDVTVRHHARELSLKARVVWCRSAGDEWYLAGCQFIETH